TRASSRSTPPDLVRPAGKTTPHRPSPRQTRSVRDPQIPIGRVPHTAPFLPAVSSLGGFRTPAPSLAPPSRNGPASETLHQLRRPRTRSRTAAIRRYATFVCPDEDCAPDHCCGGSLHQERSVLALP